MTMPLKPEKGILIMLCFRKDLPWALSGKDNEKIATLNQAAKYISKFSSIKLMYISRWLKAMSN